MTRATAEAVESSWGSAGIAAREGARSSRRRTVAPTALGGTVAVVPKERSIETEQVEPHQNRRRPRRSRSGLTVAAHDHMSVRPYA
jgi:hypothetical protein